MSLWGRSYSELGLRVSKFSLKFKCLPNYYRNHLKYA